MTAHKSDDKPKAADKPEPKAHAKKAPDVPRKGDEVDTAKLKEARREKPDETPAERVERLGGEPDKPERPAVIHALPHVQGTRHEAGTDPDAAKTGAKGAKGDDEGATASPENTGEPGTDNAQILYGLKVEGRLYRCRQEGLPTLMVEADSPEQAREAYVTEMQRRAGDDPESLKPKGGTGAPTLVPAGMALVPADGQAPKASADAVSVVKLRA